MSICISSCDGYRNHRLELTLSDNWQDEDPVTCVEALAMTAAHIIKATEEAGVAVYGDHATQAFSEVYCDTVAEQIYIVDAS
jgi:hypothetical protein